MGTTDGDALKREVRTFAIILLQRLVGYLPQLKLQFERLGNGKMQIAQVWGGGWGLEGVSERRADGRAFPTSRARSTITPERIVARGHGAPPRFGRVERDPSGRPGRGKAG